MGVPVDCWMEILKQKIVGCSEWIFGLNIMYLDDEVKRMYRFIVGHPKRPPNLKTKKQTELLILVLESLHKDEADLCIKMRKKDLKIPFLTKKLLKDVYPDLPFEV